MASVTIDVDIEEFEDSEILAEYRRRELGRMNLDPSEARRLADLIAGGEIDEALYELHSLSAGAFSIPLVKRLHSARRAA